MTLTDLLLEHGDAVTLPPPVPEDDMRGVKEVDRRSNNSTAAVVAGLGGTNSNFSFGWNENRPWLRTGTEGGDGDGEGEGNMEWRAN